jgi:hypothetical protein
MLVARYGITVCCDEDINKWDILKQMLDLDMLKDPNLCKSTLCCCPAPCLIDAVITLLPFCGAPNIVSVILTTPCQAPVLIDVIIDVPIIPTICYCYSVAYVGPEDITIHYIDCCCVEQTMILPGGQLPPGITAVCSTTPPITFDLPSGPCGCPEGFVYNPLTGLCESIVTEAPTLLNPTLINGITTQSPYYAIWGAVLYPDITSVTYPITANPAVGIPTSPAGSGVFPYFSYPQLIDGALNPLVPTGGIPPAPGNLTWGWDNIGVPPFTAGRLNVAGIWGGLLPDFEIEFCVDILTTKTYILGAGADDAYQITIDGVLVVDSTTSGFGFFSWALFPITLTAGIHKFKLKGIDTGLNFGLAFEIYDATFLQLQAVASPAALTSYIIFTTSSLIGRNVTTGPGTGYTCNIGCTLNSCGVAPICECITTAPYVPCLDVINEGLCGVADLCNPPPPQICTCWKISNIDNVPGSYTIDAVCPGGPFPIGSQGVLNPGAPDIFICSIAPPIVSGLVFTNMGPCDGYCGPIPPVCVCYQLDVSPLLGCIFTYTDCNGVVITDFTPVTNTSYICAQTVPVSTTCNLFPLPYTISSTPFTCTNGVCGPPFPCDCYQVRITDIIGLTHGFSYYDCNGLWSSVTLPDGTYYYCGSNFNTYLDPAIVITPAPGGCVGC